MRTKWYTYFVIALVVLFAVISCSNMGMAGKYVDEKNPKDYLELKSNGTVFCTYFGGVVGKYEVNGDEITLIGLSGPGSAEKGKIQGKTIIVNMLGMWNHLDRFTKQ